MPIFRFLDPTSARVVSLYRQNGTGGAIGLGYGGSHFSTNGTLPLNTWGTLALHVITNGTSSTVEVRLIEEVRCEIGTLHRSSASTAMQYPGDGPPSSNLGGGAMIQSTSLAQTSVPLRWNPRHAAPNEHEPHRA